MVYKQYTMNGSRGVPYGWRCPKCGKLNLDAYRVTSSATYDDRGLFVSLDSRQQKARNLLDQSLSKRALNTVLNAENRRFDKINFQCKCSQCDEAPAWSNLSLALPKPLTMIRNLSLAAAVILLVLGYFTSKGDLSRKLPLIAAAAALFVILYAAGLLIRRSRYAAALPAIEALAPENLPHMATSGPELLRRLGEEGMLTSEEAAAIGVPPEQLSQPARSGVAEVLHMRAEELRKQQRSKRILAAVVAVAILLVGGSIFMKNQNLKKWQAAMEAADLFAADPQAGDKFVVYETRVNSSGAYKKDYLPDDRLASSPEEVGYILVVEDRKEAVGTYGNIGRKPAYHVFTKIGLFDRHTGVYVANSTELAGGDPPKTIKSTQGEGVGSRPSKSEISKAARKLMDLVDDSTR